MKTIQTLTLVVAIGIRAFAQDCDDIRNSTEYFSAFANGATEQDARINALTLLAENISSVVSSRTDMLTNDDGAAGRQKFSNYSKSTSLLQLKGVRYITCDRNKKSGITTLAFISRKDLEQSAAEVSARVHQYLSLMEQKEAGGNDFLPEAYIAYLNTFMSPYAIEYHSDKRNISNVRGYLESYLRTFLSNITVTSPAVVVNPEYPDQQLTMAISLSGTNNTRMGFQVEIPEYNAKSILDGANGNMDIIMTPDSKVARFNARLSLIPPPLEADLKDISDRVGFSREVSFEANMSGIVKLDFNVSREGNYMRLTPVTEHLIIHRLEWFSAGTLLSTDPQPRIAAEGLKEITLRVNGNDNLIVSKNLPSNGIADVGTSYPVVGKTAITLEGIDNVPTTQMPLAQSTALFPHDAIVLVYSDKRDLSFHSSMAAIERQTYNPMAGRYELLVKPVKQILSVETEGMMEKSKQIINPQSGDILYFKASMVSLSKALLSINSYPPNAVVLINDIETIHRTPCTIEVNAGLTKVSLHKTYFAREDTTVRVDAGESRELTISLLRAPETFNSNDALSYLNGRHEREYYTPEDPAKIEAATAYRTYQRQTLILKRRAAMYYTTAVLGISLGAGYHWLDRTLFDNSSGPHTSVMSGMGNALYIMGGAALVGGIITSVKLSHVKKNWNIQPVPNPGGAGVLFTYRFK